MNNWIGLEVMERRRGGPVELFVYLRTTRHAMSNSVTERARWSGPDSMDLTRAIYDNIRWIGSPITEPVIV